MPALMLWGGLHSQEHSQLGTPDAHRSFLPSALLPEYDLLPKKSISSRARGLSLHFLPQEDKLKHLFLLVSLPEGVQVHFQGAGVLSNV